MDNLTHTLFGITLSRTPLSRAGRGTTAVLIVASNIPDIDVVTSGGGFVNYLAWHRGPTHGPLGIIALGCVSALLVHGFQRLRRKDEPRAPLVLLCAVAMIGVAGHILMDLPTSYGTRLLSPFDWHWFSIDWMPIIDIYLMAVLAACLFVGHTSEAARRRNAYLALLLMAANYGVRGIAHRQALALGPQAFGDLWPAACASPTEAGPTLNRWPKDSARDGTPACHIELAAIPTYFSPFDWLLIAELPNAYELRRIDLLDEQLRKAKTSSQTARNTSLRVPSHWTPAVKHAAESEVGQVFLGFSRFPAASSAIDADGNAVVRWTDLRFVSGTARNGMRGAQFTATIHLDRQGQVLSEALGP
jgi:membrane-bound metal-dependent hydrolase YbcI (DUF457 family)